MTHADSKPISRYFQCSNVYRVQQTGFTNPISWSYLDVLVSNYSCLHCFYTDFTDFSKKLVAILKIMQIFLVWNEFHLCTYYHPKLFCYNFMLKNSHPICELKNVLQLCSSFLESFWHHRFCTHVKFSEKLTPWYVHVRLPIRGYEILVSWKILRMCSMNYPFSYLWFGRFPSYHIQNLERCRDTTIFVTVHFYWNKKGQLSWRQ